MKLQKMLFTVSVVILLVSSAAVVAASDFDWIQDFNIRLKLIRQDSGQDLLPVLI
jgi:hypothetical protein